MVAVTRVFSGEPTGASTLISTFRFGGVVDLQPQTMQTNRNRKRAMTASVLSVRGQDLLMSTAVIAWATDILSGPVSLTAKATSNHCENVKSGRPTTAERGTWSEMNAA